MEAQERPSQVGKRPADVAAANVPPKGPDPHSSREAVRTNISIKTGKTGKDLPPHAAEQPLVPKQTAQKRTTEKQAVGIPKLSDRPRRTTAFSASPSMRINLSMPLAAGQNNAAYFPRPGANANSPLGNQLDNQNPHGSRRPTSSERNTGKGNSHSRNHDGKETENGIQLQWWHELIAVLITALTISALIRHFLFQPFYIPSQSMENTLMVNDSILVTKMAPRYRKLNRGDIVVFKDTENWLHDEKEGAAKKNNKSGILGALNKVFIFFGLAPDDTEGFLVKRIIGLPGDYVSCCGTDGKVSINGKPIDEGYLPPNTKPSEVEFQVAVPAGHIWVMGDNRQHSADSRYHRDSKSEGFVPISDVVGRAFIMVWPPERIKMISNSCAFYNIPPPVSIGNRDSYSEYNESGS